MSWEIVWTSCRCALPLLRVKHWPQHKSLYNILAVVTRLPHSISVQDLYVESFVDQDSLHSTRQSALNAKLEALATPEVLAITRPPATFPVPVPHEQQASNPSALQVERLRRHLVSVQTSLASAVKERDSLAERLEDSQVRFYAHHFAVVLICKVYLGCCMLPGAIACWWPAVVRQNEQKLQTSLHPKRK